MTSSLLKGQPRTASTTQPGTRTPTAMSGFWFLSLALLAFPVAAQEAPLEAALPSCSEAVAAASVGDGSGTYRPLQPEERLFYPLSNLPQGIIEIRYFVDDALYLTEKTDLAEAKLPQVTPPDRQAIDKSKRDFEPRDLLEGERMLELLALRPDLVRQLHKVAAGGSVVEIEVYLQEELMATLGFDELVQESAELVASTSVPLVVQSSVEGPGDPGTPIHAITAKSYLADCGDCTSTTPCDTECGWDDGKGGPVTCGEYGAPCAPAACQCEYSPSYYWTGWSQYAFYPYNPTTYYCHRSSLGGSNWHRLFVRVYRRDQIERKTVCPNCPSCSGCYVQERVVQYQLNYTTCRLEEFTPCSFGSRPCCSQLCQYGPFTPCNNC